MKSFNVDCYGGSMKLLYQECEISADTENAAKKIANKHAQEKGLHPVHFEADELLDVPTVNTITPCSCGCIPEKENWVDCPRCGEPRFKEAPSA